MKKISIEVNQAKIISYSVDLNEDKPEILASIGLFSSGKQISTFNLTTKDYYGGIQFKLPFEIIDPIIKISQELETILIRECSKVFGSLPAPKKGKIV